GGPRWLRTLVQPGGFCRVAENNVWPRRCHRRAGPKPQANTMRKVNPSRFAPTVLFFFAAVGAYRGAAQSAMAPSVLPFDAAAVRSIRGNQPEIMWARTVTPH